MGGKAPAGEGAFLRQACLTKARPAVGALVSGRRGPPPGLGPAAVSDDLGAAVDYGAVASRIVEIGTSQRVNLIERLAGLMADALLREFPVQEVRVRVRKLTPPLQGLVGTPAVELVRRR